MLRKRKEGRYKTLIHNSRSSLWVLPTPRTGHGMTDWFQIGKGVHQGCILSPCLFNIYAEYLMRNSGLEETSWNQDCQEKYQ